VCQDQPPLDTWLLCMVRVSSIGSKFQKLHDQDVLVVSATHRGFRFTVLGQEFQPNDAAVEPSFHEMSNIWPVPRASFVSIALRRYEMKAGSQVFL
jgi:hypothetical protein